MRWSLTTLWAVMLLANGALAQSDAVSFDSPDTDYALGFRPMSLVQRRSLPQAPTFRGFLPSVIDLSSKMPTPGNQGKLGSCTAWAIGYAARAYYVDALEGRALSPDNIPSPSFIYTVINKEKGQCEGTSFYDAREVLRRGALSLARFPYSERCLASIPSASQISAANDFRVRDITNLDELNVEDVKGQLAKGNPVVIAVEVTKSFDRFRGPSVLESSERHGSATRGTHAVTLTGYDESRQAFRLINSWGRGWGDKGYAWVSYDFYKAHVQEAVVLQVESPLPPPQPTPEPHPDPAPSPAPKVDLSAVLSMPCSRLDTSSGRIRGFVSTDEQLSQLKRFVSENVSYTVGDVAVAEWPQCELLLTVADKLDRTDSPRLLAEQRDFRIGDNLTFSVITPRQPSYLYVSYFGADQTVQNLVQPRGAIPSPHAPLSKMTFGDGRDGASRFTVSPPVGREMIVVISSKSPLFDRELPQQQTEREYLSELRRQLLYRPDPKLPPREFSAAYVPVVTRNAAQ